LPGRGTIGIFEPVQKSRLLLGFATSVALSFSVARGDPPLPAGVPELIGARGLTLGAYRGIAAGNDGMFTNAASLAARRRYSMEAAWLLGRFAGETQFQSLNLSVVDSETAKVTGGVAYTRVLSGDWIGNLFHVPVAFPVSERFFLGVTGKYQSLDGPAGDMMRAGNVDASAFWLPSAGFGLGVAGYNLLDAGHVSQQPRGIGVGASYGNDRSYHVAVDWRGDFQRRGRLTNLFAIGGEVLLGDLVPVRASFVKDETRNASFWSAGLGIVTSSGFALDAGYRQGIDATDDRTFAVAVKLFLSSH
jgi:hypothetical protein